MTRRLSLLAVLLLTLPAVAAPPTPLSTFRKALATEADRDWTACWARDGTLDLVYAVTPARGRPFSVQPFALSVDDTWYDPAFHGAFRIDAGPGTYTVDVGRGPELAVTVATPPVRKPKRIAAGKDTAAAVKAAFAAGFLDLTLEPGYHEWAETVVTPPWARLSGYGATVSVLKNASFNNKAITPGPHLSLYGLTFQFDLPTVGQVMHADPVVVGAVVADCTFKRCNLGWGITDCLIRDCKFENAGAVIAPPGLWLRCRWEGAGVSGLHAWHYWGGWPVALVDCTFRETDRGPCFYTEGGAITDCLFVGTSLIGINRGDSESFLVEGSRPFDRNLIFRTRQTACRGTALQFDRVARANLVRDLYCDGGRGVIFGSPWMPAVPNKDISGNTVEWYTLKGGSDIDAGAWKDRNSLDGGSIEKK